MIQVSVKTLGSPTAEQLATFKAFLASNGAETDAQLSALLRSAMVDVQEWEDKSLLDETVVLVLAHRANPKAPIRLYRSVKAITSVTGPDGEALQYRQFGNSLEIVGAARDVQIEYTTQATDVNFAALQSKVFRVAAAKFDGEPASVINKILMEG